MLDQELSQTARMTEFNELLTESEAQQLAKKLLLSKYYESKITFTTCQTLFTDSSSIYRLHGELTMRSRSWLDRFTTPESANNYRFKIEIDARQHRIMNYEIT
jgi:hypothetical protein